MLDEMLLILNVVFKYYGNDLYVRNDILLEDYDLDEFESYIDKVEAL